MKTVLVVFVLLLISLSTVQADASPLARGPVNAASSAVGTTAFGPHELPPVDGPGL